MTAKGKGPKEQKPRAIGNDQEAGFHPGENFAPRNRGEMEDTLDREAARESARLGREAREGGAVNPGTPEQTPWEARVEQGEEWVEEDTPERELRGDESPDSEVSRRGLRSPPPEE